MMNTNSFIHVYTDCTQTCKILMSIIHKNLHFCWNEAWQTEKLRYENMSKTEKS